MSWSIVNGILEISPVPIHFLSINIALRKDYPLGFMAAIDPARILQSFATFARNTWKTLLNMRDQRVKHVSLSRGVVSSSNR